MAAIIMQLDEDSENYIDPKELQEGDNLTHYIHALANLSPSVVYEQITGEKVNGLEFNHIANRLCFQYSNKIDTKKEG
jgi:hypothetical protein